LQNGAGRLRPEKVTNGLDYFSWSWCPTFQRQEQLLKGRHELT
jgi:hypothetical protein